MPTRFKRLSIRTQIYLLVLAIVLPVAALVAWYLTNNLEEAREAAHAKVRLLADTSATELKHHLREYESILARLATRPSTRVLDPDRCDPMIAALVFLHPEFNNLAVRGRNAKTICSVLPNPPRQDQIRSQTWFAEGLGSQGFAAGNAYPGPLTGRWTMPLTLPIRSDAGVTTGLLILPIDLLRVGEQILDAVPKNAVVTVVDRNKTILLRSTDAAKFVGTPASEKSVEATRDKREAYFSLTSRDGVKRVYAMVTLPGQEWKVLAGLPEAEVFADYNLLLTRSLAIGACVFLLALLLAWQIGTIITRPITMLAYAVAGAAGDDEVRADVSGPAEIESVARQFNRTLDARATAEKNLLASENRLRSLVALSTDWYWEQDADFRFSRMEGLPPERVGKGIEEHIGRTRWGLLALNLTEADWNRHRAELEAHATFRDFEICRLNAAGEEYWAAISGEPLFDEQGRFSGYRGFGRDITERKRLERQRDDSVRFLRSFADRMPAMTGYWDKDLISRFANRAYVDGFELPPEQIAGMHMRDVIGADLFAENETRIGSTLRGIPQQFERTVRLRSGREERRLVHYVPDVVDGEVRGFFSVAFDISEQYRTQAAILELKDRQAAIINASMDAIISVDENERVAIFSAAAERLFQLPAAEAIGQSIDRFIPGRFRDAHRAHIRRFREAGATVRPMGQFARLTALRPDGSEFPIEAAISHVATGAGHLFTVTLRDITEREHAETARASLETQLREAQKMQAIGTLAGGVAHDFNNIIAAILGNSELARQDVIGVNPVALESIDEIAKAARRARNLVQQILSFSRRQPTERKPVSLEPAIEESVRLLRATLTGRVILEAHCDAGVPAVLADVTQIEQVLLNLCNNAIHALGGASGRVRISLDTVQLDAAMADAQPALRTLHALHPGRTVRLAVSDDGPGMDAQTLARIFEPFFTTKPVDEGTGLGLSVVHGIVQSHEGAIVVASDPGKGSTFTIFLPAAPVPPLPPAETAAPPRDGGETVATVDVVRGRHVLYLDDDESMLFLVKRLLERRGMRITTFSDQGDAIEALRADPAAFDLVVSDYNMPGMSGLDVAREVRAIRADLPVAIASGFIDENLIAQAGGVGVRELIFKADVVEEFCDAVQRLIQ